MTITLKDGMEKPVRFSRKAIRLALERTDLVQDTEEIVSISNFYGDAGDEVDVYDGRQTYDPQTVYGTDELDWAIKDFMDLVQELN